MFVGLRSSLYGIAQISDNLRKVRTTARFLLGNLDDFKEEQYVDYSKLQEVSVICLRALEEQLYSA